MYLMADLLHGQRYWRLLGNSPTPAPFPDPSLQPLKSVATMPSSRCNIALPI